MKKLILIGFIFVSLAYLTSGQMVWDETFVGVPSFYVGSQEAGCGLACFVSMVASLNESNMGSLWDIYQGIEAELPSHPHPYPTSELTKAVVNFLLSTL